MQMARALRDFSAEDDSYWPKNNVEDRLSDSVPGTCDRSGAYNGEHTFRLKKQSCHPGLSAEHFSGWPRMTFLHGAITVRPRRHLPMVFVSKHFPQLSDQMASTRRFGLSAEHFSGWPRMTFLHGEAPQAPKCTNFVKASIFPSFLIV